ncbi:flagellar hook-length control protein FliK [Marinomonas sp. C2222]|uniref:Flagellar hook-length control protein FliK n=1 Tax=Marinomonas sargassi TaxID=2984494 RepID=A0ABT2YNC7_9GAMM|nr:flagellar hook-length control protein FliK [Marinomonas sargassi]MCV2401389.1 flagellar hook-length control protein FliK [Marinomonas sargassi]
MRADSNTVLSLSLDNPTKTTKVSKSPSSQGEAFESELNIAKQAGYSPKQASSSSSPESHEASVGVVGGATDTGVATSSKPNSNQVDMSTTAEVVVDKDGNVLQPEGKEVLVSGLPLDPSDMSGVKVEPPATVVKKVDIPLSKEEIVALNQSFNDAVTTDLAVNDEHLKSAQSSLSLSELDVETLKVAEYDSLETPISSKKVAHNTQDNILKDPSIVPEVAQRIGTFEVGDSIVDANTTIDDPSDASDNVTSIAGQGPIRVNEDSIVQGEVLLTDAAPLPENSLNSAAVKEVVIEDESLITPSVGSVSKIQNSELDTNDPLNTETDLEKTSVESASQSSDKLASLLALVQSNAFQKNATHNSLNTESMEKQVQPSKEALLLDKSLLSEGGGAQLQVGDESAEELSWVLSQMDKSNGKVVPINTFASAVSGLSKEGGAPSSLITDQVSESANILSEELTDDLLSGEVDISLDDALAGEDNVVVDEPIELRKKELETMLGRIAIQSEGKETGDLPAGGLNSSLQGVSAVRSASPSIAAQQPNLTMTVPPEHPNWANEITQKVSWVAREGGHTAHIRLDPPELGSLTVKVSVDNDATTQVSFVAATPQARDLLESQMNRLRDMLAQQGMDLSKADVDVSQQDASQTQREQDDTNSNGQGVAFSEESDDGLISSNTSYVSASGVDYYA